VPLPQRNHEPLACPLPFKPPVAVPLN